MPASTEANPDQREGAIEIDASILSSSVPHTTTHDAGVYACANADCAHYLFAAQDRVWCVCAKDDSITTGAFKEIYRVLQISCR